MAQKLTTKELFDLSGEVILLTGGYGYLGKAIAEGLAEAGAKVFVLGRSTEKFEDAFHGSSLTDLLSFEKCDVGKAEEVKGAFASIFDQEGKIDTLINNAFYLKGQNPGSITEEEWAYSMEGCLGQVYTCIREVLPYFEKLGGGKIINTASMYGVVPPDFSIYEEYPGFLNPPHYGAAKAGMVQLTRYFASLLGKEGVRVNAVSPGPFPSEQVQQQEGFVKELERKNPMGRIGQPEELKGPYVFLASKASSYMTGQNLNVDGGWTMI